MDRFKKLLSFILTVAIITPILFVLTPSTTVFADGYVIPGFVGGEAGSGSGDGGGGNNWWYLSPHSGSAEDLRVDVYIAHSKSGSVTSTTNTYSECGWPYPCAYSLAYEKDMGHLNGAKSSKIKNYFKYGKDYGYLTICDTWKVVDWDEYAAELNKQYGTSFSADDIINVLSNNLDSCFVPGNYTAGGAVDGYLTCPGGGNGSRLLSIDLKSWMIDGTVPTPAPKPSNSDEQVEKKWVLASLKGETTGTMYTPDSSVLAGYDSIQSFNYPNIKTNAIVNLSAAWNYVDGLEYDRTVNYSVESNNKTTATYLEITRRRTREAVYKPVYYPAPNDNIVKEWKFDHWGPWSPWSYSITNSKDVTNTSEAPHDRYEPTYTVKNWMNLTSETWTNDFSYLVSGSGIYPSDYKACTTLSNTNLDMTLNSGKSPGEVFTVLSDNNPKVLVLDFNKVFGVDITRTKPSSVGGIWCVSSQLNFGPVKNPANPALVSIQQTGPTSYSETSGYTYYTYPGTSPVNFQTKIRSILYGTYTLGDGRGSNYWYTYMRYAALNKLGSSYSVSAPGMLSSAPSGSVISITPTTLQNDIGLTHTFIQPVLIGEIDTKDAAGT